MPPILIGALLSATVTIAALAYVALGQQPARSHANLSVLSQQLAEQAAARLATSVQRLHQRLVGTIGGAGSNDGETLEQTALRSFPEALSLRIIPLSKLDAMTASLDKLGVRNHIEVKLLQRVMQDNDMAIESYNHHSDMLVSLASRVSLPGPGTVPAVALVSFRVAILGELLRTPTTDDLGEFRLQQYYTDSRGNEHNLRVLAAGIAAPEKAQLASHANVPGTYWQVIFTPGKVMAAAAGTTAGMFAALTTVTLLASLLGAWLAVARFRKVLGQAVADQVLALRQKSPTRSPLPELKLLSQLRVGVVKAPVGEEVAEASPATEHGGGKRRETSTTRPIPPMGLPEVEELTDSEDLDPLLPGESEHIGLELTEGDDMLELDINQLSAEGEEGLPREIFRAYDIRGNAESQLTDQLVRRIALALAGEVHERGESQVILACDGRLSSPRIREQMVNGLLDSGINLVDIGLVPTPIVYFAIHCLQIPSAVMITGSHNPATDNGLKIVLDGQTIAAGGINALRERVSRQTGEHKPAAQRGRLIETDISADYLGRVCTDVIIPASLKVVVDAGNGATSALAPRLFHELGCDVTPLFCKIDGNFPNHSPDTSNEANLQQLVAAVHEHHADLGIAFDGDGDRLAVVTGSGRIVRADELLMLFARDVVSR
ncbi:MAG: hypothetical protein ACK5HY_02465, partial [Parahaliea sp.]